MGAYITRRLLWTLLLLWVVSGITFIVFNVLPSADPALLRAGRRAEPEIVQNIRETFGLDKPIYVQYWNYMKDVFLHFDFGRSYRNDVNVRDAAARPAAQHAAPDRRRRGRVAGHRPHRRHDLRGQARHDPRPLLDDPRADLHLGAGLLARARRPLPLLRRHRALPAPPGLRIVLAGRATRSRRPSRCSCRGSSWRPRSRRSTPDCSAPTCSR